MQLQSFPFSETSIYSTHASQLMEFFGSENWLINSKFFEKFFTLNCQKLRYTLCHTILPYMQISIRSFLYISRRFLSAQIDAFQISKFNLFHFGSFTRRMWHNYRRFDLASLSPYTRPYMFDLRIVFGKSIKVWHVFQIGRKHSPRLAVRSGIVRLTGHWRWADFRGVST